MSSLAAKLSAANNSDAQAQAAAAAFSTVNATSEKAFQIRAAVLNVKAANLADTVLLLTENSLRDAAPEAHLLGNSLTVGAVGTHGLPFNSFHTVRFAIAQSFASVLGLEKSANHESRVALLNALVTFASKQPNASSLLSEAFSAVNAKAPKAFDMTSDSIISSFAALGLPVAQQWAIAIGMCYSATESTKGEGRRLLDALATKNKAAVTAAVLRGFEVSEELITNLFHLVHAMDNVPSSLAGFRASFVSAPKTLQAPAFKDCVASLAASFSLAGLVEELGPNCVASQQDCFDLFEMVPNMSPKHVAECLALFASPSVFSTKDVNAYNSLRASLQYGEAKPPALPTNASPTFVAAVKEKFPKMNWVEVLQGLDNPSIRIERFSSIAAAYKKAQPDSNLPCEAFLGRWKNARIQSQAIKFMIETPDLVDFTVSREVRQSLKSTSQRSLPDTISVPAGVCPGFTCIEFVEAVVYCASRDKEVEKALATAMKDAPALLFAGFVGSRPQGTLQHLAFAAQILKQSGPAAALTDAVASYFSKEGVNSLVIGLFGDLIANEPTRFVEAIETLAHCQLVPAILNSNASLKLIVGCAIAGRETQQTPEPWFTDRLGEGRESLPSSASDGSNRFAVAAAILEVCEEFVNKQKFVGSTTQALKALFASTVAAMLPAIHAHAKVLLDSGDSAFPADIEAEANTLFRTFVEPSNANKISPITECEKLHRSESPRDKQLFACVVHILFEECKAIGSYPWSSLTAAARLFGQLVDRNLLTNQRVQMALQFIHQAISKNDQRATEFGIMALECFYKRLEEWPHYGKQLRAIDNVYLDMRIPGVMAVVSRSLKQRRAADEPAEDKDGKKDEPKEQAVKDIGLHQHDITTLISNEDKFSVPTQIIQDQINFLVGNTDPSKLHTNAQELKRLVVPEFYPYFADYFVVKRVSLELNHHAMYLELLAAIGSPELDKAIRVATVKAVDRVLKSEKIRTDSSERSLLKNLGAWYGQITIARNIPVLARELNFKEMLHDGLRQGKLVAVVPFIAKILEHCVGPKCIFRPQNPWTMCQLECLLDVYALRDLRITLRFEIEVLLKNIGVKAEDIAQFSRATRPRNAVTIADIRESIEVLEGNDFRADDNNAMYSQGGINIRQTTPPPKTTRLTADAAPYQPQRAMEPAPIPAYPSVELSESTVVVTDDARYFPEEKLSAYRHAIVKILDPVISHCSSVLERIVNIATYTTINLVLKDFQADSDPNVVLRACTAVARSLAANLCINLRETLTAKILQFVDYLASQVIKDPKKEEFQMLKDTIYRNNYNVVLRALESQAAERVVGKVRDVLHHFQKNPESYGRFRPSPEELATMSSAPDLLRCRPPSHEQRAVYEEFFNMIPSLELFTAKIKAIEDMTVKVFEKQGSTEAFPPIFGPTFFTDANVTQIHSDVRDRLLEIRSNCAPDTASLIARNTMSRLLPFGERMLSVTDMKLTRSQLIVRDSLLYTLVVLRTISPSIVAEITELYLNDNDRWRSHLLTVELIRHKLLDLEALDNRMATEMTAAVPANNAAAANAKSRTVEFVRSLLDAAILNPPAGHPPRILQVSEVPKTVEVLKVRAAANSVPSDYGPKVTAVRLFSYYHSDPVRSEMRGRISDFLDEWVKIVSDRHRPEADRSVDTDYRRRSMEFMERLQSQNMLRSLDGGHLDCLIGTMVELGVEHFAAVSLKQERAGGNKNRPTEGDLFQKIDAFNDLLQVLLRCCNTPSGDVAASGNPPEVNLITKIISVVNKVLIHNHDHTLNRPEPSRDFAATQKELVADGNRPALQEHEAYQVNFAQRPYVRFVSNILVALFRSPADPTAHQMIIVDETVRVILEHLSLLNPLARPAFAFGWLELLCHRLLVPRVLRAVTNPAAPAHILNNPRRHWSRYAQLLVFALRFLDPFTKSPDGIQRPVHSFFRSFLKLMLVILHDFPEYILYASYLLCDHIPSCCIQLRNVVLCAFPSNVRLPDPFKYDSSQPNSDNDTNPECPDYIIDALRSRNIATGDDIQRLVLGAGNWAATREEVVGLVGRLVERTAHGSRSWNIPAINSLVVTIAMKQLMTTHDARITPAFKLYYAMAEAMDNEGRYYLINAFANQLRFPNTHTRFFSSLVLSFFSMPPEEGNQRTLDLIQEQILRVIVERLAATRPHPWGLLVTFVDLFRDDKYGVWAKPCIRCSPEVERTVMNLARTITDSR